MTQLSLTINNRVYQVACDDGQEEHVTRLASYLDNRVSELASSMGQIGDARLLVMAGLLISDELSEVYDDLEKAEGKLASGAGGAEADAVADADPEAERAEAEMIDMLARRIEAIADSLEQA